MSRELADKVRKAIVEAYPDKFSSLEDLPLEGMGKILREKGLKLEDYGPILTTTRFKHTIEKSGVKLKGIVLDLCSERTSIASVYNKNKVVCYDLMTDIIEELHKKEIKAVQGNILDPFLPFKENSFDYLFCEGFPMEPYKNKDVYESENPNMRATEYVRKVVEEMIRVTKKKAIVCSYPIALYFPREHKNRIEKVGLDGFLILLNCKKNINKKS